MRITQQLTRGLVLSGATLAISAALIIPSGAATDPILGHDLTSAAGTVTSAGSTFDAPLLNVAQPAYGTRNTHATISAYGGGGSGAGETAVVTGTAILGFSDVPLRTLDLQAKASSGWDQNIADFVQVPVALGGVAIVFNNPTISKSVYYKKSGLVLTSGILAKIYKGQITKWNDSAICAVNPVWVVKHNCKLPNTTLTAVARSDSSGTTFAFTNYLNNAQPSLWATQPSKVSIAGNGILGAAGNGGIAATIGSEPGTLGYLEYSYIALGNHLSMAKLVNQAGKVVKCNTTTVAAAAAHKGAVVPDNQTWRFSIVNQGGAHSWPISTYSWAIIKKTQTDSANGTVAVKFLDWLSHTAPTGFASFGQDYAAQEGYVSLPANVQALARTNLLQVVDGSGNKLLK